MTRDQEIEYLREKVRAYVQAVQASEDKREETRAVAFEMGGWVLLAYQAHQKGDANEEKVALNHAIDCAAKLTFVR